MHNSYQIKSDLHLHTSASDGRLEPGQIVDLAVVAGLDVIAITDHDTVEGVGTALSIAQKYPSITVIPGVEINTDVPKTEVHMLGYFLDFTSNILLKTLKELRMSRETRALQMIDKLSKLGMDIKWERLVVLSKGGSIGRPHVAQALVEAGYVDSFKVAFDKYIGRSCPAYVEHKKMSPIEVIKLIIEVKGLPVLAHPNNIENLEIILPELKNNGLVGIEIYYGGYTENVIERLVRLANKYDLIPTGGSDYHAFHEENEINIGGAQPPTDSIIKLFNLANDRNPEYMVKYNLSLKTKR